nr:hypothetical protein Iba_chr13cCG12620 [Ipomoea batatas]
MAETRWRSGRRCNGSHDRAVRDLPGNAGKQGKPTERTSCHHAAAGSSPLIPVPQAGWGREKGKGNALLLVRCCSPWLSVAAASPTKPTKTSINRLAATMAETRWRSGRRCNGSHDRAVRDLPGAKREESSGSVLCCSVCDLQQSERRAKRTPLIRMEYGKGTPPWPTLVRCRTFPPPSSGRVVPLLPFSRLLDASTWLPGSPWPEKK